MRKQIGNSLASRSDAFCTKQLRDNKTRVVKNDYSEKLA